MTIPPATQPLGAPKPGTHLPALDGVRGIAALLVLFHHFMAPFPPTTTTDHVLLGLPRAGWVGVDLFFVLSGFLITGILWQAKGSPDYFRRFYLRRALRIFPLYYGLLIGLIIIVPLVGLGADPNLATLRENQLWYWTYLTNWLLTFRGVEAVPLVHLWSLAVEEQFYLIWPAIVLACTRRRLVQVCVALVVGAPLIRLGLVLGGAGPDAAYVLTPARIDGLALGALLALGEPSWLAAADQRRLASRVMLAAGAVLAVLFAARGGLDPAVPEVQVLGFSAIAIFSAASIARVLLATPDTAIARALQHPWLQRCGMVSYGLYVLHYPLLGVLQRVLPLADLPRVGGTIAPAALGFAVLATALSLLLALASWYLWERPFLRLKSRFDRSRVSERPT